MVAINNQQALVVCFRDIAQPLSLIAQDNHWESVVSHDVRTAVQQVSTAKPTLILIQMNNPIHLAQNFIQLVRSSDLPTTIIAVSQREDVAWERQARAAGAHAYFVVGRSVTCLNAAISAMMTLIQDRSTQPTEAADRSWDLAV